MIRKVVCGLALGSFVVVANAVIVKPLTFNVTFDDDYPVCCYVGLGSGSVGNYGAGEMVYSFAEFNLSGLAMSTGPVYLTLETGAPLKNFPHAGEPVYETISLRPYIGNNAPDLTDVFGKSIPNYSTAGSFSTTVVANGGRLSFDVTDLYNASLRNKYAALGINIGSRFTTEFFMPILSVSLSDVPAAIPEPDTAWLLMAGIPLIAWARRRSSQS